MKKFVSGVLTGALICSAATMAFATSGPQNITVTYRDIKVAVNGIVAKLTDANGSTVEPFIYNGTTYLPVRAVATALGQEVSWNGDTNTVYIGKQPAAAPSSSGATAANTVLLDKDGIKVTYLGYKREDAGTSYPSHNFSFKIENTNNAEYMLFSDDSLIDNVQSGYGIAEKILPNAVVYTDVTIFDETLLESCHLSDFNTVSFKLRYYEAEKYDQTKYSDKIVITK